MKRKKTKECRTNVCQINKNITIKQRNVQQTFGKIMKRIGKKTEKRRNVEQTFDKLMKGKGKENETKK